jgi:hypothetical protein
MILLTHPFGNTNVRAVLAALHRAGLLAKFVTTLGWSKNSPLLKAWPANLRSQMMRRGYDLPRHKIKAYPAREIVRLLAGKLGQDWLTKHETGKASLDELWSGLDQAGADYLHENHVRQKIRGIYAYEDGAERSFEVARELGAILNGNRPSAARVIPMRSWRAKAASLSSRRR